MPCPTCKASFNTKIEYQNRSEYYDASDAEGKAITPLLVFPFDSTPHEDVFGFPRGGSVRFETSPWISLTLHGCGIQKDEMYTAATLRIKPTETNEGRPFRKGFIRVICGETGNTIKEYQINQNGDPKYYENKPAEPTCQEKLELCENEKELLLEQIAMLQQANEELQLILMECGG